MAKYVVSWTLRTNGTAQQNHEDGKKLLDTFAKWQAPADQNFLQFLSRVDGRGGFALIETDNVAGFADASTKFGPWLDYEIIPVVDIMDGVALLASAADFRESI
jgi:hypothetical protein